MRKRGTSPAKVAHLCIARMVRALLDGPSSVLEIAEESGLCENTIRFYMRAFKKAGAVYVAGWEPDTRGHQTVACYAIGCRPDVARPRKSRAAIVRDYRVRVKLRAAGEAWKVAA